MYTIELSLCGFYRKITGLLCAYGFLILGGGVPLYATEASASVKEPLLEMTQFEWLYTDNGVLKGSMRANEMCKYKGGDINIYGNIVVMMIEPPTNNGAGQEQIIYIEADRLLYQKKNNICIVEGNVRIRKPDDQLSMFTQQLTYDVKNEMVFTEEAVEIEHKKSLLKGNGLRATKDFKQYTIYAPTGTVETV